MISWKKWGGEERKQRVSNNKGIGDKRQDRERHLEVLIEAEAIVAGGLLTLSGGLLLVGAGHDTSLLVVTDTLLEEVGLTSQRDRLHEVEGVGGVEVLLVAKIDQETVGDELNVLAHELGVHAEQSTGESISQELLLNADGLNNDVLDNLGVGAGVKVGEEQTGEVGVETLVTRDKLVGESQTGHQTTLLQPEDRGEGAGEEDTLNSSEGNETGGKGGLLVLDPADGPVSLLANARN